MKITSGFSLVELSIMLVILGLLVGGILGGQSLIRAAELRSVTTDVSKFVTAVNSFAVKYQAVPGDMPNATAYWGAANADPGVCPGTQGTGTETCNGNGNGKIYMADSSQYYEMLRTWQHLSNAGLVEGNFTGVVDPVTGFRAGGNVPTSKVNGGGYLLFFNPAHNGQMLRFFRVAASPNAILSPEDAYGIDQKIDDGKPDTGKVLGIGGADTGGCTSGSPGIYSLAASGTECYLEFYPF